MCVCVCVCVCIDYNLAKGIGPSKLPTVLGLVPGSPVFGNLLSPETLRTTPLRFLVLMPDFFFFFFFFILYYSYLSSQFTSNF